MVRRSALSVAAILGMGCGNVTAAHVGTGGTAGAASGMAGGAAGAAGGTAGAAGGPGVGGGGGQGGAGAGGAGGAPKCGPDTVFDPPVLVDGVNVAVDNSSDAAQLSPDELTIYFGSNRPGDMAGWNLWTATRPALGLPFTGVTPLSQVNSSADEDGPSVTADGLNLYYCKGAGVNTGPYNIYRSTRASTAVAFGPAALVPNVNISGTVNGMVYVVPDGSALYQVSTVDAAGQEIYRAQAAAGGGFDPPVHLSELGSSADESDPVVTADELTIYFGSTRGNGAGGIDIWTASRTSTAQPFGTPRNVSELNTSANDAPSWISPDGCRLYIWRNAIYVASRKP
jgi:hypothetical protein